jgi:SAM-dependent methyltransferase
MANHVCPWWLGYWLAGPLRRLRHDPGRILQPYVSAGMLVLEPGPGMGFFTLELARIVGAGGRVVAVDIQPKMLSALRRRARRARLLERIDARLAAGGSLGVRDLAGKVDFALAFAVVHEVPDQSRFFTETSAALKRGARMLISEPSGQVTDADFAASLALAKAAGLQAESRPKIPGGRSAVLVKV